MVCIVSAEFDLPVAEHILSNGMKVISVERMDSPVVAFALYYRVGSVDEKPGKTGLAHFCEHMMFKSTKHLQGESFARLMATIGGGHSNANTSFDRTCYHQTVAPDRLEFVIRLEAERMANLCPSPEETMSELEVVKEELRLNYLDNPQGRMRFLLHQSAFDVHPYKTITIGKLEDVETFTYDDIMNFYRTYYVPNNAVAVVVGHFKTQDLMDLMETHFGSIKRNRKVVRSFPEEPIQTNEQHFEIDMPVQRSMIWVGYHVPSASHPDSLPLNVLATVLARGKTSPFGRLAHGADPVAMYVAAWFRPQLEPGLFSIVGLTLPGISTDTVMEKIDEIIDDVIRNGVSEDQLKTARTQILADDIYQMQSCMGIAKHLGEYEMVSSWRDGINLADNLAAITPEKLRQVTEKYLAPANRTVGTARSENDAVGKKGDILDE
ncbi:MAG: pitrilysin family protein [bacterium]